MLLAPWLARTIGLRPSFLAAMSAFLLASVAGGLSQTLGPLILSRVIQGAAGGLITTLALMALANAFAPEQRGRAMALYGMGVVMAPTLAPTLGGFVMQVFGWRAVLFIPVPFCLLALVLALRILPRLPLSARPPRFDAWGALWLFVSLAVLLGGLTYLQLAGWPGGQTLTVGALAASALGLFVRRELQAAEPLVNLRLFSHSTFAAATLVAFHYGVAVWGAAYVLPLFLQIARGLSPLETGLVMLPSGIVMVALMPAAGRMADRVRPRYVIVTGLTCFAVSFMLLAFSGHASGVLGLVVLATLIAVGRGIGLGIIIPTLDATASRALPHAATPDGLAMMNFLRQLGGTLSPSIVVLILEGRIAAHDGTQGELAIAAVLVGYNETLIILGATFLLAVVPAWRMRALPPGGERAAMTPRPD